MRASSRRLCIGLLGVVVSAALMTAGAAQASAAPGTAERGALLKAQRVATHTRAQVVDTIAGLRLPGEPAMSTAKVRFGATAYRLTYGTVGADGAPTTATGLLLLPHNHRRHVPVVSYGHGTMAARADAPSRSLDSLAGGSALLFAGAGFAVAAPDYLGLGFGPGAHPYMQLATEASASLDLLRAAHAFTATRHRELDDRTLVTGFSQGAAAAMALGKLLADGADPHLRLAALAPISGPYDLEHAELPALRAGRLDPAASSYYVSYLMHAWQPLYHVYDAPTDVWRGPWAARVDRLFDGRHDDVAIMRVLPPRPAALFAGAFWDGLSHPDGALLSAIRENDVACDWAPGVPIRLFAAHADEQVAYTNARSCVAALRAHVRDVGATGHFGSALRATPKVAAWFQRL